MLSITKDLEVANGIKASIHPEFVFLTSDNLEDSYKKIIDGAPVIASSEGKYSLMFTTQLKLIDSSGNVLDIDGYIIAKFGKNYFIVFDNCSYKVMNSDGQIVANNLVMDYVGNVVSFHDIKKDRDLIVTPDAIISLDLNAANVVASLPGGYYFIHDEESDLYMAYDSRGNYLKKSNALDSIKEPFSTDAKKDRELANNTALYEKVIISEFQRYPELCDYEPKNLLDMLAKAVSLDSDFYIDLKSGSVYSDKFAYLLKISDGKHDIWVPDTEEERKVMEEFCLKRRRDNNE